MAKRWQQLQDSFVRDAGPSVGGARKRVGKQIAEIGTVQE
jgi:hypothetical protein